MAVERTYIMLKPDCVRRGLMGRVISRIEDKGYKINVTSRDTTQLYARLKRIFTPDIP